MNYAPILIPTLNRYEHLKRCIESLAANDLAKETELYIALDYPPSEKYVEGYKKNKEYLESGIEGFKEVHIIYRDVNYGAYRNPLDLFDLVFKRFDVCIFTEDDNVFSKNFLQFMNQGLQSFENNMDVMTISAYTHTYLNELSERLEISGYNSFLEYDNCGWGYVEWKKKRAIRNKDCNIDWLTSVIRDESKLNKVKMVSKSLYVELVETYIKKYKAMYFPGTDVLYPIDMYGFIWNIVNDKYCLIPTKSKVKNCGIDGSGLHGGTNETGCDESLLDLDISFGLNAYTDVDKSGLISAYNKGRCVSDKAVSTADFWVKFCRLFGRRAAVVIVKLNEAMHTVVRLTKKAPKKIYRILFGERKNER